MFSVKKNMAINGKFKNLVIMDDNFVDIETGEVCPVVDVLRETYGDNAFDMTTTLKDERDITPEQ